MYPKVNESIIIDIPTENKTYISSISEVRNEDILVTCPIVDNLIQIIPTETPIEITYISDACRLKFHSEIIGRTKDKIPLYQIKKPKEDEIEKIQSRDNFRVHSSLNLKINQKEFTTLNISGGGLLFLCPADFELVEEEIVSGNLLIPTSSDKVKEPIPFEARVARINLQADAKVKQIGIAFTAIDEKHRMKIIQYCFQKQKNDRLMKRE